MRLFSRSILLVAMPAVFVAQDVGPKAGTWGAEGNTGTATLVRFRSEASALLFAISGTFDHDGPFATGDRTSLGFRLGSRRYTHVTEKTRPFRTFFVSAD